MIAITMPTIATMPMITQILMIEGVALPEDPLPELGFGPFEPLLEEPPPEPPSSICYMDTLLWILFDASEDGELKTRFTPMVWAVVNVFVSCRVKGDTEYLTRYPSSSRVTIAKLSTLSSSWVVSLTLSNAIPGSESKNR